MKTFKILVLIFAFSSAVFYSCSDENSISNETTAQKSTAIRTVLNKLKLENPENRSAVAAPATAMLCFDFVFPITFSYNNGTAVTATTLDGLLQILRNESSTLYLSSVVFPFQVQYGGAVHSINNEAELVALIIQCGLPTFNDDLEQTYCFDIDFPIQVGSAEQIFTLDSQDELNAYLNNPNNGTEANIIFPITIITGNETTVLNSVYDFYSAVNDCSVNECICTLEYAPVCVQTPNGLIEFSNLCFALCHYTINDIVSCEDNPNPECSIDNLVVTPWICNSNGTYPVSINFDTTSDPSTVFEVYSSNNNLVGTFTVGSLPVTIQEYPYALTAIPNDNLTVKFSQTCTADGTWMKPNCNPPCICPTVINPVCVQTPTGIVRFENDCLAVCAGFTQNDFVTCPSNFGALLGDCFSVSYPVTVQYQGALVVVNNDGELRQYWNGVDQVPMINYPITVTFDNVVYAFESQAAFEAQINISCP